MDRLRPDDVLMVLSDHGFTRSAAASTSTAGCASRAIWSLKPGTDGTQRVAARCGLDADACLRARPHGMFLNLEGREGAGIVKPGAGGGGAEGRDHRPT